MNKIYTIAKRELATRLSSPSFLITTFFAPIIFIVPILALMWWQSSVTPQDTVLIADPQGLFATDRDELAYNGLTIIFTDSSPEELQPRLEEEAALLGILDASANNVEALKYIIQSGTPPEPQYGHLVTYINDLVIKNQIANLPDAATFSIQKVLPELSVVNPTRGGLKIVAMSMAYLLGLILYLMFVIYTNSLLKGVVEEKQNRIVEVVNMVVKPEELMFGKIFGIGLAGFLQLILIISVTLGLFWGLKEAGAQWFGLELTSQSSPLGLGSIMENYRLLPLTKIIIFVPIFFILGFLMNGAITAAIGATTNDDGDNSLSFLGNMINIFAIYFAMIAISMPDSAFAKISMFIPFVAPIVTPSLIPFDLPVYMIILSLIVLLAAFIATALFAGKIYRISMLTYGKKIGFKDVVTMLSTNS